jgi:hypothetical protein
MEMSKLINYLDRKIRSKSLKFLVKVSIFLVVNLIVGLIVGILNAAPWIIIMGGVLIGTLCANYLFVGDKK